jgi:hypothetical protein
VRTAVGPLAMLFWFVGCATAIVWNVFRDPGIDYRILAVGALLPDVIDVPTRHLVAHSVTFSVGVLVVLMLTTIGRRAVRRRLLMLPIGMLLHLVVDGAFSRTNSFWWPATGLSPRRGNIFSFTRPLGLNLVFEGVGILILWRFWRRFGLDDRGLRRQFRSTGRLPTS